MPAAILTPDIKVMILNNVFEMQLPQAEIIAQKLSAFNSTLKLKLCNLENIAEPNHSLITP